VPQRPDIVWGCSGMAAAGPAPAGNTVTAGVMFRSPASSFRLE